MTAVGVGLWALLALSCCFLAGCREAASSAGDAAPGGSATTSPNPSALASASARPREPEDLFCPNCGERHPRGPIELRSDPQFGDQLVRSSRPSKIPPSAVMAMTIPASAKRLTKGTCQLGFSGYWSQSRPMLAAHGSAIDVDGDRAELEGLEGLEGIALRAPRVAR